MRLRSLRKGGGASMTLGAASITTHAGIWQQVQDLRMSKLSSLAKMLGRRQPVSTRRSLGEASAAERAFDPQVVFFWS